MKHGKAILIKFLMTAAILELLLLWLTALSFAQILWISAVAALLAYLIGDLLILRVTGSLIAAVADIALAALIIYAFNWVYAVEVRLTDALIAAIGIGAGEWFFHKYVAWAVFPDRREKA